MNFRRKLSTTKAVGVWACLLLVSLPCCLAQRTSSVGFSVRKLKTPSFLTLVGPARVKFQDTLTNLHGAWDEDAGEFVAPRNGAYFFTFNGIGTKDSDFTLALMKNGEYQVTAYGGPPKYEWAGNSALLVLNWGDKVYLELQDGSMYDHPGREAYTTFSGFLVFEWK
ncbi:cerebellin-4-like [Penaeus monodon]|uniref:cerebellin-4-like n=1 Tax=Penaeus monodon TaxID=6687 RepID=UPI0018A75D39|nr:cerebellin-4-like [Penaeus monodon]